jgi:U4/U6.U5 tri-snRNP-associated protein 1
MLPPPEDLSSLKIEPEDENLKHILSKARRLKQKENIIKRDVQVESIKPEVKIQSQMRKLELS